MIEIEEEKKWKEDISSVNKKEGRGNKKTLTLSAMKIILFMKINIYHKNSNIWVKHFDNSLFIVSQWLGTLNDKCDNFNCTLIM